MPRLTAQRYLQIHDRLRRLWLNNPRVFAELSPMEQWRLHDFFKPDQDWSPGELLQHREAVTKQRPSLPRQAGRALEKFWGTSADFAVRQVEAAKAPPVAARRVSQQDRKLTIKAIAQPDIDPQKLARAYINLSYQRARERAAERADHDHDSRSRP